MAAFLAVVTVLVAALNIINYNVNCRRLDMTLDMLAEFAGSEDFREDIHENFPGDMPPGDPGMPERETDTDGGGRDPFDGEVFPAPGLFGGHSREARFMTRFFWVITDGSGEVTEINADNISSVTKEAAGEMGAGAVSSGRDRGFSEGCRYAVYRDGSGSLAVFLNAEREVQSMKTLLLISCLIGMGALGTVFILVVIFSGRAIAPYVRNIRMQKQFITDAGHELKTPLTSISASADILAMEYPDSEWAVNIRRQSERMAKLIGELVSLSRLDEEQGGEWTEFSLSETAWELCEGISSLAAAKGRRFSADIEDNVSIIGDPMGLSKLMSALLDNAVKYSDDAGCIEFSLKRQRRRAVIRVFNTLPPETQVDIDRIFDRFYRGDISRASKGSFGIGLSAAAAVAMNHRGSISAVRTEDGGIVFTAVFRCC